MTDRPFLSQRAQDRLNRLHRALHNELRALNEHHTRLMGAMHACDAHTQYAEFLEFRQQVEAVAAASEKLQAFIDHYCAATPEQRAAI
jgi:hypothetical protein